MYDQPFYITDCVSNNAFSFDKRENPTLYVPALKEGILDEVAIGDETVFEDFDDEGVLKTFKGLRSYIKHSHHGIPVYIFDNHNHAFYFWHLERDKGTLQNGATLIHIDQHKDTRIPESLPDPKANLQTLFKYTNTVLNVGNFIPPAQKTGLIENIINIDSAQAIKQFQNPSTSNLILDIDLDFFAPELDYIDNNKKLELIQELIPKAKIITVATSPFFIEQTLAIKWLRKIFK